MSDSAVASWIEGVVARHQTSLTPQEFTRALRALSARYVEQRHALPTRSPLDSAGKRAAFAAFYAPLHFLTVEQIVVAVGLDQRPLDTIIDLGCGTGVASAAWARLTTSGDAEAASSSPGIRGVDASHWVVEEARWNWRRLGVHGRLQRGDLVEYARHLERVDRRTGLMAAWSVNELAAPARAELLRLLLSAAVRGATVLVIEPLAKSAAPWWDDWASAFQSAGGRADTWKFEAALPAPLARIDASAGFNRDALGARSLSLSPV